MQYTNIRGRVDEMEAVAKGSGLGTDRNDSAGHEVDRTHVDLVEHARGHAHLNTALD